VLLAKDLYTILLAALLLSACGNGRSTKVTDSFDLRRLEGRWEYVDNKTHQIEEWAVEGETNLEGRGFVLDGRDTTFIEFLSIQEENNVLTYFARPSSLNSNEIIPLQLQTESKTELVFVNPNNEFPKKIIYRLKSDSLMQVYIEGSGEGKIKNRVYDFVKQKSI